MQVPGNPTRGGNRRAVQKTKPVPKDIDIAQAAEVRPILDIAASIGLEPSDLELFGTYKAKVHLDVREKLKDRPNARYIDVTAITPTPLGEGKTTTTIGLHRRWDNLATRQWPPSGNLDGPNLRH